MAHPLASTHEREQPPGVALVSLPFHMCETPPIGLGLLKAALAASGLRSTIYNLNLDLLPELGDTAAQALERYSSVFNDFQRAAVGEWLFAPPDVERDERYLALLPECGFGPEELGLFRHLRGRVNEFLRRWACRVASRGHDIVGFAASLDRTRASVRLAEEIRRLAPATRVVVGGLSACDDMGCALLEAFPAIDLVCHTEADELIVPIVRALRHEPGWPLEAVRGVSYRLADRIVVQRDGAPLPDMERTPVPDYEDYFEQVGLLRANWDATLDLPKFLPMETARGCWWGERRHCIFCGFNSDRMAFRAKSAERVLRDLEVFHERYGVDRFYAVDTVLSRDYFDSLLPRLAKLRKGCVRWWAVRPNLTPEEVIALRRAGVAAVQPGIESLSTPVLRLMRKGTSAIDNIQTLKWCLAYGIECIWNALFSVPGERIEWYDALARTLPRLMHLPPPTGLRHVSVVRFSPQFTEAHELGIRLLGPKPFASLAFGDVRPDLVERLAYDFRYAIEDRPADLDARIQALLGPLITRWRETFETLGCTLSLVDGPEESLLVEGPLLHPVRVLRVTGAMLRLLRACESTQPEGRLRRRLADREPIAPAGEAPLSGRIYREVVEEICLSGARPTEADDASPAEVIDAAEQRGWLYREAGRLLSLPVNQTLFVKSPRFLFETALRRYPPREDTTPPDNSAFPGRTAPHPNDSRATPELTLSEVEGCSGPAPGELK